MPPIIGPPQTGMSAVVRPVGDWIDGAYPVATAPLSNAVYKALGIAEVDDPGSLDTNLKQWVSSTDDDKIVLNGSDCAELQDKSAGTAYDYGQTTAAKQPAVTTDPSTGVQALLFDGSDDWMEADSLAAQIDNTDVTIVVVGRHATSYAAGTSCFFATSPAGAGSLTQIGLETSTTGKGQLYHNQDGGAFSYVTPGENYMGGRFIGVYEFDDTTHTLSDVHINGTQKTITGSFTSTLPARVSIGHKWNNTTSQFNFGGYVYAVLVFTVKLTANQRKAVEAFLGQEYGMRGVLPVAHTMRGSNTTWPAGVYPLASFPLTRRIIDDESIIEANDPGDFDTHLQAWFDPNDADSFTESTGEVDDWTSKAVGGDTIVQATGADRPTRTAVSTYFSVVAESGEHFDPLTEYAEGCLWGSHGMVICRIKYPSDPGAFRQLWHSGQFVGGLSGGVYLNSSDKLVIESPTDAAQATVITYGEEYVVSASFGNTASELYAWGDGAEIALTGATSGTDRLPGLTMLGHPSSGNGSCDGGEFLAWRVPLSDAMRDVVRDWIANESGVTLP